MFCDFPGPCPLPAPIGWKARRREPSQRGLGLHLWPMIQHRCSELQPGKYFFGSVGFYAARLFLQPKHGGVQHRISEPASLFFREATSTWLIPSRLLSSPFRIGADSGCMSWPCQTRDEDNKEGQCVPGQDLRVRNGTWLTGRVLSTIGRDGKDVKKVMSAISTGDLLLRKQARMRNKCFGLRAVIPPWSLGVSCHEEIRRRLNYSCGRVIALYGVMTIRQEDDPQGELYGHLGTRFGTAHQVPFGDSQVMYRTR